MLYNAILRTLLVINKIPDESAGSNGVSITLHKIPMSRCERFTKCVIALMTSPLKHWKEKTCSLWTAENKLMPLNFEYCEFRRIYCEWMRYVCAHVLNGRYLVDESMLTLQAFLMVFCNWLRVYNTNRCSSTCMKEFCIWSVGNVAFACYWILIQLRQWNPTRVEFRRLCPYTVAARMYNCTCAVRHLSSRLLCNVFGRDNIRGAKETLNMWERDQAKEVEW